MPVHLMEAIQTRVLLSDGAMGTQLQQAGLKSGECGELWNVEAPEKIKEIQKRYADAGADLLLTNTFGGSLLALERNHGLGARCQEINEAAAKLARGVMGPDRWVAGDLGPYGGMLEPYGDDEEQEVTESFRVQALGLLRGGVDALIVETQTALEEAKCGVIACKKALEQTGKSGQVPIIVSFAFDASPDGPRTMMGLDAATAAAEMAAMEIDILAANCGTELDITGYREILKRFRANCELTLMAQPNAGSPERVEGKIVYHQTAQAMAQGIPALIDLGARVVGGCCGTTPEHIAEFRKVLG